MKDLIADKIDLQDQLIRYFKPIEQLFRIMNAVDPDAHGGLVVSCSEIGLRLAADFREHLETLLGEGDVRYLLWPHVNT